MVKLGLILGSILVCIGQIDCVLNPKVVCYYEDWFVWRFGDAKMTVEDIDSSLCTHIVYAYLGVSTANDIYISDPWLMVENKDLVRFSDKKGKAKALVAIGGASLSGNFSRMVSSVTSRDHFVNAVLDFLKTYNFDGITLDWSQIAWVDYDFENFAKLLESLSHAFNGRYVLGISVATRPVGFSGKVVDKFVDYFEVQTFDHHGSWEMEVGHQAPLDWQISVLNEWRDAGVTPHKLLMTIPLFAHTWILDNPANTEPGARASRLGDKGPFSQVDGKLFFNELCLEIKQDPTGWQLKEDANASGAAYAIHGKTWVTFESITTAKDKAHNATSEGFGGVVVQALANEDFRGLCGVKYPLLKAINEGLNKEDIKEKICRKVGKIRDPHDCNVYHVCTQIFPGSLADEPFNCGKDEAFDQKEEKCKNKAQVDGCH